MIYLVTTNPSLIFEDISLMSLEEALFEMESWEYVQYDSETTGRNAHINELLCMQFGNINKNIQIVVDNKTISPKHFKGILEGKVIIGQNLKFDLQFLYNYGIHPLTVYDTMIVEQLLYLGYPPGKLSYSLKAIAERRLGINIDKTVRGEIIWRGLDKNVLLYAGGDVTYLEDIMTSQIKDLKKQHLVRAASLENQFVPVIAYMEWCGIRLDEDKWRKKMEIDQVNLKNSLEELNKFIVNKSLSDPLFEKFTYVNLQGDLFSGFDTEPKCTVNWSSPQQVIPIAKLLGFNTLTKDKKTGNLKNSVQEDVLKKQKGICDEFLQLYLQYQEYDKVCTSFGGKYLNSINPITGRIHSSYRQLGTASGRMACGSKDSDTDLAKLKKIPTSQVSYPNIQQLPSDELTRGAFVPNEGNVFCSCDYSAAEARLGADIYQDKEMLKEYTEGSGDAHSIYAWMVFRPECEACGCKSVLDVKKLAPNWRKAVKAVEFAYQFGAGAKTIAENANCTIEQAQQYIDSLNKGFSGMTAFARRGAAFVKEYGYVLMCKYTGHKMYWWDHKEWKAFMEEYNSSPHGMGLFNSNEVREKNAAGARWERRARNAPTQGTCAIILKKAMRLFYNWIIENDLFGKVLLCALVHDEACIEYPKDMSEVSNILIKCMEDAASEYCKSLPIPAEASVGDYWIH